LFSSARDSARANSATRQFCDLESLGLAQKNTVFHNKNSLAVPLSDMNMNRNVVVAIEKE